MTAGMRHSRWREVRRHRHFYYFIAPFFVLFAIFGLYPLLFSLVLSFGKWDGMTPWTWVGLHNFAAMGSDDILWRSLWNTLVIGVLYVPPMLVLAFLFALILNAPAMRFRAAYRAAFFLPAVTPMVVIAIVFSLIFSTEKGVLNWLILRAGHALPFLHLHAIPWITSETWSKPSIALLTLWRWTGYNMILMLAGLQGIPTEYYEAAMVDGATPFQRMRAITAPLMRPTFLFCLLLSVIGTIFMFDEVFVLTNGGPGTSSINFGLYLFNVSFGDFKFGYASCIAYSLAVVVFAVTALVAGRRGRAEREG
jgi:ABC-type sugar transport system permease subunit